MIAGTVQLRVWPCKPGKEGGCGKVRVLYCSWQEILCCLLYGMINETMYAVLYSFIIFHNLLFDISVSTSEVIIFSMVLDFDT